MNKLTAEFNPCLCVLHSLPQNVNTAMTPGSEKSTTCTLYWERVGLIKWPLV